MPFVCDRPGNNETDQEADFPAYSIERAELVASVLERFTTSFAHQLVGIHANLDYWMCEAKSALDGLDQYNQRFARLEAAQREWIGKNHTLIGEYCAVCRGQCELEPGLKPPRSPTRVKSTQRNAARRRLVDAVYHFLARCCRQSLLTKRGVESRCAVFGTSVEPKDLRTDD